MRPGGRPLVLVSARALLLTLAAVLLALSLCVMLGLPSSARAEAGHPFLSQLALPPAEARPPEPTAVAVDSATGNVFVAEDAAGVVVVYSASGAYITQFGGGILGGLQDIAAISGVAIAADGRVYVADKESALGGEAGTLFVFKPDGLGGYSLLSEWRGNHGRFGDLRGVAVDNSTRANDPAAGRVYVDDGSANAIYVMQPPPSGTFESSEGTLLATLTGKPKFEAGEGANTIAVDSATGAVYVTNPAKELVEVFNASGEVERTILGKGTATRKFASLAGVAVEEGSGDVYVADQGDGAVDQFNSAGESVGRTNVAATTNPFGPVAVAIDNSGGPSRGHLVVVDVDTASVDLYGAGVPVPAVTTGKASAIERAPGTGAITATLSGTIDPEGHASAYHFEYRRAGQPFTSTATEPVIGLSPTEAHATVSLLAQASYEFRVVGEDPKLRGAANYGLTVPVVTPSAVSGVSASASANVGPGTATLTGSLSPQGIATSYHFDYGETIGYGKATATGTALERTVAAEAPVSGLTPGRTYHFRLAATNEFGTTYSSDQQFTTPLAGPPTIASEAAEGKPPAGEELEAQVNGNGEPSRYHFDYGESEAYGTSTPEAEVPSGGAASAEISGLKPEHTYHFRVIVTNAHGEAKGPDVAFVTSVAPGAAAAALPDGRAYELVSPPDKHGGYIEPLSEGGSVIQASEDGNALTYIDVGGLVKDPEGSISPEAGQVLSTRGSTSWSTREIVAPTERVRGSHSAVGTEYLAFSANLSLGLLQPTRFSFTQLAEPPLTPPLSQAERGHQEKSIYLRADAPLSPAPSQQAIYEQARQNGEQLASEHGEPPASPGYVSLVTGANTSAGTEFGGFEYRRGDYIPYLAALDATPDLSHVMLSSQVALTGAPSGPGLYEWAAGSLQLASVLPSGQPATPHEGAVELGSGHLLDQANSYEHAISDDGSRVIWTQTPEGGGGSPQGNSPRLFLRDMGRGQTIQLDAPVRGVAQSAGSVIFQTASADGSKVFFTDTQPLTQEAKATVDGSPPVARPDLYECAIVEEAGALACRLSDLTAPEGTAEAATVQGVVGASEDGSYVYVLATGVLAPGAQPGGENLYVLHDEGGTWSTTFIRALSSEDYPDWAPVERTPKVVERARQTARVSPNGRYLAFMSNRRLTGYDNTDVNEEGGTHADEEVFLYDAATNSVSCASCNPSGARPRGVLDQQGAGEGIGLLVDRLGTWVGELHAEGKRADHWLAGSIPGATPNGVNTSLRQPRYLTDSGRLFFTSADALVPEAAGRTRPEAIMPGSPPAAVGIENVYQYEPDNVGSCSTGAGCVALISSGTSERESALLDASTTGNDVFFLTDSKLLPQDTDSSYDIYDARVCTSASPCLPAPSAPPAECASSEVCRPVGPPAETLPAPLNSSSFYGPGNTGPALGSGGVLPNRTAKPRVLTRAQRLTRALRVCRRRAHRTASQRKNRARCEARARRQYGSRRRRR